MTATIDLIIFGRFYNATSAALSGIANNLRTAGSSMLGAAIGTFAQLTTFGGSEFVKNLIIGFCDGWSTIISGCTNAKTKFSRTCDFTVFANEIGSAWGQGLQQMFAGIKGGISAVLSFLKTGVQALAGALASAGLVALGLTATVIIGLINGLARLIQMGAAAVQSLLSAAIIAAGKVLSGAGQAVSAVGGGMQAAGAATVKAGQAMKEGRSRRGMQRNEVMQKFADDLLHASTVSRYLASLDESTRRVIVTASI